MLVLVLIVVGFVGLSRLIGGGEPSTPVRTVDYHQTLGYAREHADFHLLAPPRLPQGWRATSVTFVPRGQQRWHLGVLTDRNQYVGLEQADRPVRGMVTEYVDPDAERGQPVTVRGRTWSTWSDAGGDHALVRRSGDTTTLVVGPVDPDVLVGYVRSLR